MCAFFPTARLYQHDMLARLKIVTIFLIVHLFNGISGLFVPLFSFKLTLFITTDWPTARLLFTQW